MSSGGPARGGRPVDPDEIGVLEEPARQVVVTGSVTDALAAPRMERGAVTRGGMWALAQTLAQRFIAALVFIVLARILDPSSFGLIALAYAFLAIVTILNETGFSRALIQRDTLTDVDLNTAFWISIGTSAVLTTVCVAAAFPLERAVDRPGLAPVFACLALSLVIQSLAAVPQMLLQRAMRFKELARRTFLASAAGGVVGVGGAFAGLQEWSIVLQALTQAVVGAFVVITSVRWRPGRTTSWASAKHLLGFGGRLTANSALNFLNRRLDDLLIGIVLGPVALGLYNVAYRLLLLLTEVLVGTVDAVAFPVFSRLQNRPQKRIEAFFAATRLSACVAMPTFLLLAALAPDMVRLVFGSQWEASGDVMRILALMGVLHSVFYFNNSMLAAAGRPGLTLLVSLANAAGSVIGFSVAVPHGIRWVAAAYVIRGYVLLPLPLWALRRAVGIDLRAYGRQFVAPMVSSLAAAASAWILRANLPVDDTAAFVVAAILALGVYVGSLRIISPRLLEELLSYVRSARDRRSPAPSPAPAGPHR